MSTEQIKASEITRLVPWFGANARHAARPAQLLGGCKWVYIPFAGSMCEVPHFPPSVLIMVSDKHEELISLARVVRDDISLRFLATKLADKLFHPRELQDAKEVLREARSSRSKGLFDVLEDHPGRVVGLLELAEAYFVVAWMGRSAVAGTRGEESVGLALRYDAGGGCPVKRYHAAVDGLEWWCERLRRCSFTCEDVFDVLARLRARKESENREKAIGVYMDPPWPDDGDGYLHTFTAAQQRQLAKEAATLPGVRVVMRFGDHPLIRELYPAREWTWLREESTDQHGGKVSEVYLVRRDGEPKGQTPNGQMAK